MSGPRVAAFWRHPIKSHGRERVARVTLARGQAMPWDRCWAVTHEATRHDGTGWSPCREFSIGSKSPGLQAIEAESDRQAGTVTLRHPERPTLTIRPDDPDDPEDAERFIGWVRPISNPDRARPAQLVRVEETAMTDTDFPSLSLINLASHAAVEAELGQALSPLRWRGNILFEGFAPWAEMRWIGKRLRLGHVEMEIIEPIQRCMATTANPETGQRDADTLGALNRGFGHQDCGVYARVVQGGQLHEGDPIEVLA